MSEERKPTIDERLEALTHTLELFQAEMRAYEERQRRLDGIERRGRRAILMAIGAYLEELHNNEDGGEGA